MTGTISTSRSLPGGAVVPAEVLATPTGVAGLAPTARLGRPIAVTHAVTLALAFGVWAYLDRNLWFFGDEWDFLTRRGLHGATFSIWAPHNEHWSVLPILLWRAIFAVAHLSTYWPYLVPLLLAHVAVVYLLWRRCLREGADPWVATALALLFALFGTGAEDLAWAFQVGFVSSLALGLVALEVAEGPVPDHRAMIGNSRVRQLAVWLLMVASVMCSDVGVATAVAVGVVVLARNGWRRAIGVLLVPAAVYAFWFASAGRTGLAATGDTLKRSVFLKIPTFVATNLKMDLGHALGWPAAGVPLAIGVVAWLLWRSRPLFRSHPAVLGGAIAAVSFYALAALGRDRIRATLSPSRYAYIGMALLLPAVALMLSAIPAALQRWCQGQRPRPRIGAMGRLGDGGGDSHPSAALLTPDRAPSPLTAGEPPSSGRGAFRLARAALLAVVAVATAANLVAGAQFTRSRAPFVRGLKDQIITTAALLQNKEQLARAVNVYPVWASGFASGYLTPWELAKLYRLGLLPRPVPALMTATQVREDESWLDLTASHNRVFGGRFVLLSRSERSRNGIHTTSSASSVRRARSPLGARTGGRRQLSSSLLALAPVAGRRAPGARAIGRPGQEPAPFLLPREPGRGPRG